MEDLPINSDTINKSIDLIDESTKETRKEIDKTTAKGFEKLTQLIWASPVGRTIDLYIAERPYKMEKALAEMKQKYEPIPVEYKVEPSSYIALKGVNELNYSLDEEHLKEMFQNLLVSDMDARKKSRVLPSYIEIIKHLSKDDANFLKLLYKNNDSMCSILLILQENGIDGYNEFDSYAIYNYKSNNSITSYSSLQLNRLVLDNLLMHRLIEVAYDLYYSYPNANKEYETLFNSVKNKYNLSENMTMSYKKGLIRLTDLGKNFIDICLS